MDGVPLEGGTSDMSHHLTAKLLFLVCKSPFLCPRIEAPDRDDNKKVDRTMIYLQGSRDMVVTLEADDNLHGFKWWVDALFAVHWAMQKSHRRSA